MPNGFDQDMNQGISEAQNVSNDNDIWEVIVKYSGDIQRIENELGAEIELLGENIAIITLRADQIAKLYDYKEIVYIEMPRTLNLVLNRSLRTACIAQVHDPISYNLTGKGVLVGIIDSGIDYTHPDFLNPDNTSRVLYLWDQTTTGTPPSGFRQGMEFDNDMINMALNSSQPQTIVSSDDRLGHGTSVAGIAVGNGRSSDGYEKGAAPEASLIIVKLGYRGMESFARTTEIMRALKYIIDKAEELEMPVSINLSFGTNDGSHDGNSLFETYINSVSQRWKTVISVATGNEGAAGHHFSGNISTGQTMDVSFVVAESIDTLYLSFWKNFVDQFTLELILPSGRTTGVIDSFREITDTTIEDTSIRVYYGQPTHYNEDQEILFIINAGDSAIPQGLWHLRVRGTEVVEGNFDIWLPTMEEVGQNTAFTDPAVDTTLTLPSTVYNVISVGGYNDLIDAAASFSGRGFTRNNVYVKPDLVAPAVNIISTRSGGGYDSFTGTSIAAPFVTGAVALMMQWGIVLGNDPFLYGQRVKAYLKRGATRKAGITYPNQIWGYGSLCLRKSMDYLST